MEDTLAPLGWDAEWVAHAAAADPTATPARVTRVERGGAECRHAVGVTLTPAAAQPVAVGDWVLLHEQRIVAVLPRRTTLTRASVGRDSAEQMLAANVDDVVIVEPLTPRTSLRRVERLLVLAWSSGAAPLVVLSKRDTVTPDELEARVAAVEATVVGAPVVAVSARTSDGVTDLAERLTPGRTAVLLGPSGAGKSSLVNALAGRALAETGALRADGKGRHTTAWRQLDVLPDGPVVIDTPGLRAVGLVGDTDAVDTAFADVAALAEGCRFRDCGHTHEPGCAVVAATDAGDLPPARLESWRRLQREAAWQARRGDARLMAAERARWKAIHKDARGRSRP